MNTSSLRRLIYAKLQRTAIATVADPEFQPSEAEMMDTVRELLDNPSAMMAARSLHPNFDALSLSEKYALLIAVSPDHDVAQNKMEQSPIEIPYSESEIPSEK